jgi:hypothetical protein
VWLLSNDLGMLIGDPVKAEVKDNGCGEGKDELLRCCC